MVIDLHLNLDCNDVEMLAGFWVAALGYEDRGGFEQYRVLEPPAQPDGRGVLPKLLLQRVAEPPHPAKNRLHIDLIVGSGFEGEADRLESLGARRLSGVIREAGTAWIVMADPEGNEFCLCEH